MTKRFIVEYREASEEDRAAWVLIDTATNTEVGRDGGEPEDQLLVRDWKWVPEVLNKLAVELEQTRKERNHSENSVSEYIDDLIFANRLLAETPRIPCPTDSHGPYPTEPCEVCEWHQAVRKHLKESK